MRQYLVGILQAIDTDVGQRYASRGNDATFHEKYNQASRLLRAALQQNGTAPTSGLAVCFREMQEAQKILRSPNPKFVVFCGDAGSGKSATINALVGHLLLPSAAEGTAVTKFPCLLRRGDTWKATVNYFTTEEWATGRRGKRKRAEAMKLDLPKTYTMKFATSNALHAHLDHLMKSKLSPYVKECLIQGPAQFLVDGKTVVDLPGSNDVHDSRIVSNRKMLAKASFSAIVARIERVLDNRTVHELISETRKYRMQRNTTTTVSAVVCTCSDANLGELAAGDDETPSSVLVLRRNDHVKASVGEALGVSDFAECFCVSSKYFMHRECIKRSARDCCDVDLLTTASDWTEITGLRNRIQRHCDDLDGRELTAVCVHISNAMRALGAHPAPDGKLSLMMYKRRRYESDFNDLCVKLFGAVTAATAKGMAERREELASSLETGDFRPGRNPDGMFWSRYRSHVRREGIYTLNMNLKVAGIIWASTSDAVEALEKTWSDLARWAAKLVEVSGGHEKHADGLTVFHERLQEIRNAAQDTLASSVRRVLGTAYAEAGEETGRGTHKRMLRIMRKHLSGPAFVENLLAACVKDISTVVKKEASALLNHVFADALRPPDDLPQVVARARAYFREVSLQSPLHPPACAEPLQETPPDDSDQKYAALLAWVDLGSDDDDDDDDESFSDDLFSVRKKRRTGEECVPHSPPIPG